MQTRINELFDVEFPIFAFTHCRDVVAAVSRAGGLGVLGAVGHTPEQLDIDLAWIRDEVGGRPFGVDIIVPARYEGQGGNPETRADELAARIPEAHRRFLDDLLARYEVPPLPERDDQAAGRGRDLAFSSEQATPLLDVAFSHPISLIVNALGTPPPHMMQLAAQHDVRTAALAGKASHAARHAAAGVDFVVAQGYEAGGHTGDIATMVLLPEVVDAVDIPVVAAGGIGGGRQMAAALALGAEGVWCGSVWLTTAEAETHPTVKQKFLEATSSDTVRSRSRTGKPARQLRSAWTDEWDGQNSPGALPMPLQSMLIDRATVAINRAAHSPDHDGARALANYFVGQVVGSMNESRSASQVVLDMVDEFVDALDRLDRISRL